MPPFFQLGVLGRIQEERKKGLLMLRPGAEQYLSMEWDLVRVSGLRWHNKQTQRGVVAHDSQSPVVPYLVNVDFFKERREFMPCRV
jgi:hypothetical protein